MPPLRVASAYPAAVSPRLWLVAGSFVFAATISAAAHADNDPMTDAVTEFDAALKGLSLTAPCDSMCKALQSMVRAADRICELSRDGTASDQKRCTDAKQKVAEATAKVRAACPDCNPSPPYAPSTTPGPAPVPPMGKKSEDKAGTGKATVSGDSPVDEPAPAPPPMESEAVYRVAGTTASRRTTLSLDLIPLFAPPFMIQPRIERNTGTPISIIITGGYGSLPKSGPNGATGRTSAFAIGGEVRAYFVGRSDRFGIFAGVDAMHRSAHLEYQEDIAARTFPLGLTIGGLLGTKLVLHSGFTLEARAGAAYVASDRRVNGGPKVIPSGGVSIGWTF
jgi:hypothetical protein